MAKNFLRVGEQIPLEHSLQLLDVTMGDKMVYQLFFDTEQSIAYVTWNATVMGIGNLGILSPFMEEKKRLAGQWHSSITTSGQEETGSIRPEMFSSTGKVSTTSGQKDAGPIRSTVVSQGKE